MTCSTHTRKAFKLWIAIGVTVGGLVATNRVCVAWHAIDDSTELVRKLQSEKETDRKQALEQLLQDSELAEKLLPELVKRLKDESPKLRVAAVQAIVATGAEGRKWLPHLIKLFSDTESFEGEVRVWLLTAKIVGHEMGKSIVPDLILLLDPAHEHPCRAACVAIAEIGHDASDAVDALVRVLKSEKLGVLRETLYALRRIGPASAKSLPQVVGLLDHKNMHIQYSACQTLAAMGPLAEPAVGDLIRVMSSGTVSVKRHAALALGSIGPKIGEPGIAALIAGLDAFAFVIREDSLSSLGKLGKSAHAAGPVIKQKLIERKLEPVGLALTTYWQITGDLEFVKPRFLVRFADVNDAIEAVPQLSKLGPEAAFAVPSLVKATKSEDLLVRLFAAEALGKIGVWDELVQAAIDQLIETATDLDVREAAQAVKKQQQDKPDQNSPK